MKQVCPYLLQDGSCGTPPYFCEEWLVWESTQKTDEQADDWFCKEKEEEDEK